MPAFVTVPAYPGAQMVQEEMDVLPVEEPVVEMPVGHNVHDVAPDEAEYDPGGQTAQNGFV